MRLFTSGDVVKITGLPARHFDVWCREGHIKSMNGASGQGHHRIFNAMQVLGIAVANELRQTDQGCALPYFAQVVRAFSDTEETQLLNQFSQGATHLVMVYNGKPILDAKKYETWIDVQEVYRKVVEG